MLRWHVAAVGLCALHVLLAWWARGPGFASDDDDGIYLTLARSLRHGGYNNLFQVGTPFHSQYPPGYPAFLAAIRSVFGTGFDAAVVPGMLASALALFLVYRVLTRMTVPPLALAILAALAVNPLLVRWAGLIRSTPLYMLLSLACVTALARRPTTNKTLFLAGVTAIAAALTRSIGVALLAALAVHWLLERRFKAVIVLGLSSAVTVGAWLLWTVMAPHKAVERSYVADLMVRPAGAGRPFGVVLTLRILGNLKQYVETILPYHMPFPTIQGTPVDNAIASLLVVMGLATGLYLLWRRWRIAALYLIPYAAILLAWPWTNERFTLPVLPLVVPAVFLGLGWLAGRVRAGLRVPVVLGLACITILTGASRTAAAVRDGMGCDRSTRPFPRSHTCLQPARVSFFQAVAYIRDHVPPDATFLTARAGTFWYYSGHQTVFFPDAMETSEKGFVPFLRSRGVGWILLGSLQFSEKVRMARLIEADCSALRLVAVFPPGTYLFRLPTADEAEDDGTNACKAMAAYRAENPPPSGD